MGGASGHGQHMGAAPAALCGAKTPPISTRAEFRTRERLSGKGEIRDPVFETARVSLGSRANDRGRSSDVFIKTRLSHL